MLRQTYRRTQEILKIRRIKISQQYSMRFHYCTYVLQTNSITYPCQNKIPLRWYWLQIRLAYQYLVKPLPLRDDLAYITQYIIQIVKRLNCCDMSGCIYLKGALCALHITTNPFRE